MNSSEGVLKNDQMCFGHLLRCVGFNQYEAEELFQELILGVLEKRKGWNQKIDESDIEHEKRLCRLVFSNYCRDGYRNRKASDYESIKDFVMHEENALYKSENIDSLKKYFEFIEMTEVKDFILYHITSGNFEKNNYGDTAEKFGLSPHTIKDSWWRFRNTFKEKFYSSSEE